VSKRSQRCANHADHVKFAGCRSGTTPGNSSKRSQRCADRKAYYDYNVLKRQAIWAYLDSGGGEGERRQGEAQEVSERSERCANYIDHVEFPDVEPVQYEEIPANEAKDAQIAQLITTVMFWKDR
jgi:hypothetical protein